MKTSAKHLSIIAAAAMIAATPAHAESLEGARVRVLEKATDSGLPCPKSTFSPVGEEDGEAFVPILGAIASSFAGKAVDAFVDWLQKRKDRLGGSRAATFTGNFYDKDSGVMKATCVTFTAGTFSDDGSTREKIYAEFVPISYDGGTFTLKPVYLAYNETVAPAGRKKPKFTSLVLTYKFNAPKTKDKDDRINSFEMTDGPVFAFTYGEIKPGAVFDYRALAGITAGLGGKAPLTPKDPKKGDGEIHPIAYQIGALWTETAEPSPLYTAAVGAIADNKTEISAEIGKVIREILGMKKDD